MAFNDSSTDESNAWLLSLAKRKEGDDMDVKSWISFALAAALKFST